MTLLPDAAIFDLDGTLCDVRSIRHYVTGGQRNMDAFHTASSFCPPNQAVLDLFNQVQAAGIAGLVVSARRHRWWNLSTGWLAKYRIEPAGVWLRPDDDLRPDVVVKLDILAILRQRWNIILAVDDNPPVADLWRTEGIETVFVPGYHGEIPLHMPVTISVPAWLAVSSAACGVW